jgi:hypothetical protein
MAALQLRFEDRSEVRSPHLSFVQQHILTPIEQGNMSGGFGAGHADPQMSMSRYCRLWRV